MNFYKIIRSWLGFKERDDYISASILNCLISKEYDESELRDLVRGREIAVVGAGPQLDKISRLKEDVIIAADGATNYLINIGVTPDIIVTDLDGLQTFPKNSIYVVLAHGDNINLLHKVKEMDKVIPNSQVMPFGRLRLYGGFSDGDRAVVLAKYMGASKIRLYAMDFESGIIGKFSKPYYKKDVPASMIKRKKLEIARMIIEQVLNYDE
ncbi:MULTISPECIES: 6-hydroxymethylpterin diphosphokinase MptE-like protein [Sulfolobaceae]|uniref:6-hydroxymethylpterin diphosphokinase MptE-like protein n=1 Tax=Sulfolobaceae TaxID=118883 RepID=UPI0015E8BB6D|nr:MULTISPECIES: 6-hydroxymethylpterin diphosphokinase MptE-like protein [unclassified Sulfolobus]